MESTIGCRDFFRGLTPPPLRSWNTVVPGSGFKFQQVEKQLLLPRCSGKDLIFKHTSCANPMSFFFFLYLGVVHVSGQVYAKPVSHRLLYFLCWNPDFPVSQCALTFSRLHVYLLPLSKTSFVIRFYWTQWPWLFFYTARSCCGTSDTPESWSRESWSASLFMWMKPVSCHIKTLKLVKDHTTQLQMRCLINLHTRYNYNHPLCFSKINDFLAKISANIVCLAKTYTFLLLLSNRHGLETS